MKPKPFKLKRSFLLITIMLLSMLVSACGGAGGNSGTGTGGEASASNAAGSGNAKSGSNAAPAGKTKVVWWHSMGGELGTAADQLVSDFNASQDKVEVEAIFQGTYDESLNKMKASMDSKSGPSLIQVYEIGSRFMIDSGAITPVQQFIDAENYDLSHLEENIMNYYTFEGKQYSMPFNTSNPILYYNKDLFKAAGLDPDKAPATYEELKKAAEALSKNGAPASFAIYGWFMEQFFANQGAEYVDNGNGRTAAATQSLVNEEAGVKTLEWWKSLIDGQAAINLGRKTDDTKKAFVAGQVSMTLDSTAGLRGIVDSVGDKFEVGTAFLPKPDGSSDGGVIIGGASLWVLNNKPDEEQQAAWEFIKFLAEPKTQAKWHIATGYFPITKKAYDEQIVKDNLVKYPQFQTAVDQLHASKPSLATQGAVMGVFPEARQIVENAIEEALGGSKSTEQALNDAAKAITDKIGNYNKTVKK